jgi:hypothetical protein
VEAAPPSGRTAMRGGGGVPASSGEDSYTRWRRSVVISGFVSKSSTHRMHDLR